MSDAIGRARKLLARRHEDDFILVEVKDEQDLEFLRWVNALCDHHAAALAYIEARDGPQFKTVRRGPPDCYEATTVNWLQEIDLHAKAEHTFEEAIK